MITPITNIAELVQALTYYQRVRCLDANGKEVACYHINTDRDRYTGCWFNDKGLTHYCDLMRLPDIVKRFNNRTTNWVIGWD